MGRADICIQTKKLDKKFDRVHAVKNLEMTTFLWFFVTAFAIQPWTYGLPIGLGIMIAPLLLTGLVTVYLGAKRLSRPMK